MLKAVNYPTISEIQKLKDQSQGLRFAILDRDFENSKFVLDNNALHHKRYNPSLSKDSNGNIFCTVRTCNRFFTKFIPFVGPVENIQAHEGVSGIDFLRLSTDLVVIEEGVISPLGAGQNLEDVRPNLIDGTVHVLAGQIKVENEKMTCRVAKFSLQTGRGTMKLDRGRLLSRYGEFHKNWVWFEGTERIVTQVNPLLVLENSEAPPFYFDKFDFRGGSNFVHLGGEEWLGVVRKWQSMPALNQLYKHYFVKIDFQKNAVTISKPFSLTSHGISICNGLYLTEDHVFLSWGFYDRASYIAKWDIEVVSHLFDFSSPEPKIGNNISFISSDLRAAYKSYKLTRE